MQGLYEKYVRFGYYEQVHPWRASFVSAIATVAILWPVLWRMDQHVEISTMNPLLYAGQYAFVFAILRPLFSRSRRACARFERWAAKHPEPGSAEFPRRTSAKRTELPHGRDLLSWFGWTLLVAFFVYWVLGLFLITATGADNTGAAVVGAIAAVISIPAAIYLRLSWPPARDWKSRS
jgi:hypothetical protein